MDLSLLNFDTPVDVINQAMKQSLIGNIGITVTAVGDGVVEGFLILSEKNCRPDGILHGGTNLAMAETLAGLGSMLIIDMNEYNSFGIQVSWKSHWHFVRGKLWAKRKLFTAET